MTTRYAGSRQIGLHLSGEHVARGCPQCVRDMAFLCAELAWLSEHAP